MSYLLINKMTTKPGKRDEVINILLESGKAFDNNDACLMYLVSQDRDDENVIWVQDAWTSEEEHQIRKCKNMSKRQCL
jgi:quinol monooxygenase YgiN